MTKFFPLIILGVLAILSLGISMGRHGRPQENPSYNTWNSFVSNIVEWGLIFWFLAINHLL